MNSERKSSGVTPPTPRVRSQLQNTLLAKQNENSSSCLLIWERSNAWRGHKKEFAPYTEQLATIERGHATKPESSSTSKTELRETRELSPSIDDASVESSDNLIYSLSNLLTSLDDIQVDAKEEQQSLEKMTLKETRELSLSIDDASVESSDNRSYSFSNLLSSLDDIQVDAKEEQQSLEKMTLTELIDMLAKVNDNEDAKPPGFLTAEKPPLLTIEELTDVLYHVNSNADSEIRWDVVHKVVHQQAPTCDEANISIEHIDIQDVDSLHSSFSSISTGSCGTDDFLDSFLLEFKDS